jgi:hypothetical protein
MKLTKAIIREMLKKGHFRPADKLSIHKGIVTVVKKSFCSLGICRYTAERIIGEIEKIFGKDNIVILEKRSYFSYYGYPEYGLVRFRFKKETIDRFNRMPNRNDAYEMAKRFVRKSPLVFAEDFPEASDPGVNIVYLGDEDKRWSVSAWVDTHDNEFNGNGSLEPITKRIYFDCIVRPDGNNLKWFLDLLTMGNEAMGRKVLFDRSKIEQKGDKETDKETDDEITEYISLMRDAYNIAKTMVKKSFSSPSELQFPDIFERGVEVACLGGAAKSWSVSAWVDAYELRPDGTVGNRVRVPFACIVRPDGFNVNWFLDVLIVNNEVLFDRGKIEQKGDKETDKETDDEITEYISLASRAYRMAQTIVRLHLYISALAEFPKASDPGVNIVYLGDEDKRWSVSAWVDAYELRPDGTVGNRVKVPFACIVRPNDTGDMWYIDKLVMNNDVIIDWGKK